MMKEAIAKLMNKQDLTYEEARQVMDEIMDGKVSATLISSYLTALSMKGQKSSEKPDKQGFHKNLVKFPLTNAARCIIIKEMRKTRKRRSTCFRAA